MTKQDKPVTDGVFFDPLPEKGLELPSALFERYEDKKQIARMPFVINDSVQCSAAYEQLKDKKIDPKKDVFVGIAGLRSLDLLATIGKSAGQGYEKAVLFDNNLTQMKAMNNVFVLIRESATPDDFIKKLIPHYLKWVTQAPREDLRMKGSAEPSARERKLMADAGIAPSTAPKRRTKEDVAYFAVQGATYPPRQGTEAGAYFAEQMHNPDSWLHPDNFPRIKAMVENKKIDTVLLELDDKKRFGMLSQWLGEQQLRVGDMYLSSALGFMTPADHYDYWGRVNKEAVRTNAHENIRSITDNDTRILNSRGLGLALGATTGVAQFVLHVDDKHCDKLKGMLGKSLSNQHQLYTYTFNAGHATCTIKTPSSEDLQKALGNPVLAAYDEALPNWRNSMSLFTCEISCPDYIAPDKAKAFVESALAMTSKVIRAAPYAAQDLHVAYGDRNARVVFMVPNKELKNDAYIGDMANAVRKGLLKDTEKGLRP